MNINKIILSGYIGQNPDAKTTNSGVALTTFSLGNTSGFGENKKTLFIKVICWRQVAEYVRRYAKKGDYVVVVGRLDKNEYTDKTGKTAKDYQIIADDIELKSKNGETPQQQLSDNNPWKDADPFGGTFKTQELDYGEQSEIPF